MISARIRNIDEYLLHRKNNARLFERIQQIEDSIAASKGRKFILKGFSYPAQQEVGFRVDYRYDVNGAINWRERVVCPVTNLNSRLRAAIHFLEFEKELNQKSRIYIAEQLTPLYEYFKKKFPFVTGSEYLGPSFTPGQINKKWIRHEDATNLSFKDGELDCYMSFECFEHIPDFMKAFTESYRVLKPGGMLYWTAPFSNTNHKNIIRATQAEDGTINHLLPPDYHGNPVTNDPGDGILCYHYFGWEVFDQLKSIGYTDAYAIAYWSDTLGYYGGEQFLFCAIK